MAKKTVKTEAETTEAETTEAETAPATPQGGSVTGYFRPIFAENPGLLKAHSNEFLYQKWLQDHPGETEVPLKVKQGLSSLKTLLRKKLGAKRGRPRKEQPAQEAAIQTPPHPRRTTAQLEQLEQIIDDTLALAKEIDRDGLQDVIRLLRSARNRLVMWMGGY